MHNILQKMFLFLFLSFSMLLLCGIFRLKEFKVKNGLTTSLIFFFLKNDKNLDRCHDTKRRKKEDGLERVERSHGS